MTRNGKQRKLGRTAPHKGDGLDFSLVGSMLTAAPYTTTGQTNPRSVFWWNLADRTSGVVVLAPDAVWIGSAPAGFVYVFNPADPDFSRYFRERVPAGTTTPLRTPYPGALDRLVTGPTGIVGVKERTALVQLTYMSYNGDHTTKLHSPKPSSDGLVFPAMSHDYVSFTDEGQDGEKHSGLLVPLDGGKPITVPHPGYQAGHRVTYGTKHPTFLSSDGHPHMSEVKGQVVAAAFGAAIVTNADRTSLRSLANPHAPPKVLLATR
jgi:hypothetical protein